jgi:hypothetical protein
MTIYDKFKTILPFLFRVSDRISTKAFHRASASWVLEIGVHQGEVARHYNGMIPYIGFEANPSNITQYNLTDFDVHNFAIVPQHCTDRFVNFEIPVRNSSNYSLHSGKGSILNRNLEGWDEAIKIKVPALNVGAIANRFNISLTEKKGKVWVDAEGVSVSLVREIYATYNVSFCHFEYDFKHGQYKAQLDNDLSFLAGKKYIKARTSHDQYNIIVFFKYDFLLLKDKIILNVIDYIVNFGFIVNRLFR